ncbi:chitinase domain-containing protein 1 [Anastrepha obliqua]|uniref:chitinase domain-containing protein 1 n=1 Tax=Anastrepha obliqua TaxID=95512 RepID=UPI002409039E|nr:chitinase domain-containing protein 1 [Anastrepha obliqua]
MPTTATYSLLITVLLIVFSTIEATLSPRKGRAEKTKTIKPLNVLAGPHDESVFERNLIDMRPLPQDILEHNAAYYKDTSLRNFNGTVLGYVTAWNSHGYDVAKWFARKFDIISPVWFQIVKNGDEYELAGTHDIDRSWMREVRRKGKNDRGTAVKIFPRFIFDKFTERDFSRLLSLERERVRLNELLVNACKQNEFDGVVIEFWTQIGGRVDEHFLITLVQQLHEALKKENLRLILVIPPYRQEVPNLFTERHLNQLYKHVYAFSLMTYDYSNVQRPGANSPLYWVRQSVELLAPATSHDVKTKRRKILLGLNMYGNDYTSDGGGPIVAAQYLKLLNYAKKRVPFDELDVENYFEVKAEDGRHMVFYPSLYSVHERIKLAQELGTGISIWELGQGLDYFYDLF